MKDIAIIGMAGRFPEADTIDAFRQNLATGRDNVREFSTTRKSATTMAPGKQYMPIGFMEDIDLFDHKFFQISKAEAEYMDPHQRILMEVIYETLESSGYDIDFFNGSETAVFIGDTDQDYAQLAERFDPTLVTGTTNATTAGRVSRFFNFRGNALMVDTACSSSLLAVHMACNELLIGDAAYALACGIRFILFPAEQNTGPDLGIMSRDGRTRSFAASAAGSGAGEAAGCVLLKPLDKALADGDIIYAVIKGTAANQDAQLSGSLTAPSSQAQSEVIRKTWEKGTIDPATISYIEAHGSGTKLGDPIEIAGMDLAFKGLTGKKHFCAVSSVKSNIGHTGSAAGISGLIKAVLSLRFRELYPSVHFDQPNPFIDFKRSVVYVNDTYKHWDAPYPRRAGVSSFGLSGTNCHVLLEEAPVMPVRDAIPGPFIFNCSAKSASSLRAYRDKLAAYLEQSDTADLSDISYTLNNGRKHYAYRASFVAADKAALIRQLKQPEHSNVPEALKKIVFLFSGDGPVADDQLQACTGRYPDMGRYITACKALCGVTNTAINRFMLQYALYRVLEEKGLGTEHLLGTGNGDLVVAVLLNEMTLEEALASCTLEDHAVAGLDQKLSGLVRRETEEGRVAFIELGPEGCLSRGLQLLNYPDKEFLYTVVCASNPLEIVQALYLQQFPVDWARFYGAVDGYRKVNLPAYSFDKTRCWLKAPLSQEETAPADSPEQQPLPVLAPEPDADPEHMRAIIREDWSPMEQKIAAVWIAVLKLEELSLEDDFFRLGGHSLMATKVIAILEKEFGVKLIFKDIFTFATVRSLARGLETLLESGAQQTSYNEIQPAALSDYYPLSEAQRRLWLIHQSHEKSIAYNLPSFLLLAGDLDITRLEAAFQALCDRHESLRTSFGERNARPVQLVADKIVFKLQQITGIKDPEDAIRQFLQPFELNHAPLMRVGLAQLEPQKHLLLFDMHHIISDGVSLGILLTELVKLYHNETLPPLRIQYKDFVVWQQEAFAQGLMQAQENYWLQQFASGVPLLQLHTDKPRPAVPSFEGDKLLFELPVALVQQVQALAAATASTPFMVLLSVYNVLLHKYTGQEDIVVGSPIAGRSHGDLDQVIGMFVNTLVFRNKPAADHTFLQLLGAVKENALNAYQNQDYPFALLVDKLDLKKDRTRNPLFDVMFVLQNIELPDIRLGDLCITPYPVHTGTAQFDLVLEINEAKGNWPVKLEYNTALFEAETILLMKERFLVLLQDILATPEKMLANLSFKLAQETIDETTGLDFAFNF
ncbi:condensation domain-containing protein [Taibaiella chishuiensis]|uniref:Phosphopantetheine binding protein n=1 Tax=Taibaiella chishuiensis TaxID=1434707 RepID=A0A2P8CZN7_9BACT|nr:condensation domain-containing protein [Taibaiella chishuiensis]PSK90432.1 phosphopantetheine binding protein [Taibaiella chishuiensis]